MEVEEDEKEREHSMLQDQIDKELRELDKRLEQKEVPNLMMPMLMIVIIMMDFTMFFQVLQFSC